MAFNMACWAPTTSSNVSYTFDDGTLQEAVMSNASHEGSSSDSAIETDYQHITPLFKYIEREDWKSILLFLSTGRWSIGLLASNEHLAGPPPATQVKTWVTKYDNDGNIEWSQLPIHAAISCGAPCAIIQKLGEMYPKGLHESDNEGMLPLHLAFGFNAPDSVITFLLATAPETIHVKGPGNRYPYECCELGPNKSRGKLFKLIIDQVTHQTREDVEKERLSFPVQEIVTNGAGADAILQELASESNTSSKNSEKHSKEEDEKLSKEGTPSVTKTGLGKDAQSQDRSVVDILKDLQESGSSSSYTDDYSRSSSEVSDEEGKSNIFTLNNSTIDTRSLINHPFAKIMTPRGTLRATPRGDAMKKISEEEDMKESENAISKAGEDTGLRDRSIISKSKVNDGMTILAIATNDSSEVPRAQSESHTSKENEESTNTENENPEKPQSGRFGRFIQSITTPKGLKKTDSTCNNSFQTSFHSKKKKKMPSKQPRLPPGVTVLSPRMSSTGLLDQSSKYVSVPQKEWASEGHFPGSSKSISIKKPEEMSTNSASIVDEPSASFSTTAMQNTGKASNSAGASKRLCAEKCQGKKNPPLNVRHNVLVNEGEEYEAVFSPLAKETLASEPSQITESPCQKRDPDGKHADKGRHHGHVRSMIPPASINDELSTLDILAQFAVLEEEGGIEAVHCK